jgi:tetratricopeptide (TPR) repeat protein
MTTTRIVIDPNIRVRENETYAGIDDVVGPVEIGDEVEVVEPESGLRGPARVVDIDTEHRLVYLAVDWAELKSDSVPLVTPTIDLRRTGAEVALTPEAQLLAQRLRRSVDFWRYQGNIHEAERELRRAARYQREQLGALPLIWLARLYESVHRVEATRAAWEEAVAAGTPDAPEAMFDYAVWLVEHREIDNAIAQYERTVASGHVAQSPRAAVNLALLLWNRKGDSSGAIAAAEVAISVNHPYYSPQALLVKGMIALRSARRDLAEEALGEVVTSRNAYFVPRAAWELGLLYGATGRSDRAEGLLDEAVDAGFARIDPSAVLGFASFLVSQRDVVAASRFALAVLHQCDDPDKRAAASAILGLVEELEDETAVVAPPRLSRETRHNGVAADSWLRDAGIAGEIERRMIDPPVPIAA